MTHDALLQFSLVCICHLALGFLWDGVLVMEDNTPIKEKSQARLHGVRTSLHDYKLAFGQRL